MDQIQKVSEALASNTMLKTRTQAFSKMLDQYNQIERQQESLEQAKMQINSAMKYQLQYMEGFIRYT